jgi:hypothetical protein
LKAGDHWLRLNWTEILRHVSRTASFGKGGSMIVFEHDLIDYLSGRPVIAYFTATIILNIPCIDKLLYESILAMHQNMKGRSK